MMKRRCRPRMRWMCIGVTLVFYLGMCIRTTLLIQSYTHETELDTDHINNIQGPLHQMITGQEDVVPLFEPKEETEWNIQSLVNDSSDVRGKSHHTSMKDDETADFYNNERTSTNITQFSDEDTIQKLNDFNYRINSDKTVGEMSMQNERLDNGLLSRPMKPIFGVVPKEDTLSPKILKFTLAADMTASKHESQDRAHMSTYVITRINTPRILFNDSSAIAHGGDRSHKDNINTVQMNTSTVAKEVKKNHQDTDSHHRNRGQHKLIQAWTSQMSIYCDKKIISYGNYFFVFHNITITRSLAHADNQGGEDITKVMNRTEDAEMYTYKKGFFCMNCSSIFHLVWKGTQPHIKDWLRVLKQGENDTEEADTHTKTRIGPSYIRGQVKADFPINYVRQRRVGPHTNKNMDNHRLKQNNSSKEFDVVIPDQNESIIFKALQQHKLSRHLLQIQEPEITQSNNSVPKQTVQYVDDVTVALVRYEYANVYWNIVDLYTTFLTLRYLGHEPNKTNILFVDAHPRGSLDGLWPLLFKSAQQLHSISALSTYRTLIWGISREQCPLLEKVSSVPYMAEFRLHFLQSIGISQPHSVNCENTNIKVLFVWRRDYVTHPRNPKGIVSRKITNEAEIFNAVVKTFRHWTIQQEQLDKLDIQEQVRVISSSDIMIGMHGAAFAYSFLLPPGGGAVEMFPQRHAGNWHMEYIAKWGGVKYSTWKNTNSSNEDRKKQSTYVPPEVVIQLLSDMHLKMCQPEKWRAVELIRIKEREVQLQKERQRQKEQQMKMEQRRREAEERRKREREEQRKKELNQEMMNKRKNETVSHNKKMVLKRGSHLQDKDLPRPFVSRIMPKRHIEDEILKTRDNINMKHIQNKKYL